MENRLMDRKVYEKPEIRDFGSLERLTAACSASGAGDYVHPGNSGFSTSGADSQGHTCTSSP